MNEKVGAVVLPKRLAVLTTTAAQMKRSLANMDDPQRREKSNGEASYSYWQTGSETGRSSTFKDVQDYWEERRGERKSGS